MDTITVTQLYEQLTIHMGKETAENLCSYINCKISEELEDQTKILATKADVGDLKSEINDLKLATKADIGDLRSEINDLRLATKAEFSNVRAEMATEFANVRAEIANVKLELLVKLGEYKSDTMRWMFIFWVGQVAVTFGLCMLFLKK